MKKGTWVIGMVVSVCLAMGSALAEESREDSCLEKQVVTTHEKSPRHEPSPGISKTWLHGIQNSDRP